MSGLLRPAISLFIGLSVLTGIAYPLAVAGIGRLLFAEETAGSLLVVDRRSVGSRLIGQHFTDPAYFWGRPSATPARPYDAAASGGSNLGPLNPALSEAVRQRIAALQAADPGTLQRIPVDLVTASASGLDPHISPQAAAYQVERVARQRRLPPAQVSALVAAHTEGRQWGVFGEPRVNVLLLNIALDVLP